MYVCTDMYYMCVMLVELELELELELATGVNKNRIELMQQQWGLAVWPCLSLDA